MLNQKTIEKVVFLDLESTSQYPTLADAPVRIQEAFKEKFKKEIKEQEGLIYNPPTSQTVPNDGSVSVQSNDKTYGDREIYNFACEEIYNIKAPLFAEFNKIICISMGLIDVTNPAQYKLKVKSFVNADEKTLLKEFVSSKSITGFNPNNSKDNFAFCAHNGKVFDFPMIAKRLIYNGIDSPYIFDISEKKSWDINWLIDTKEAWKFGVFDGNVSLDLLSAAFNVESSKMLMKGADVKDVYYLTKDMAAIQQYCERDIFTLASIYLKMKNIQIPLVR